MPIRQTHTYVTMEVSGEAYDEIRKNLEEADYDHAIHDDEGGALDMHGLALVRRPPPPKTTSHASMSPGPANCNVRLSFQKSAMPRTCERCGLGPCPFFNKDGTSKIKE